MNFFSTHTHHESDTERLHEARTREIPEKCHDPEHGPFAEVAAALSMDAARPVDALDVETAKNQKISLLNMAHHFASQSSSPEQGSPVPPSVPPRRFLFGWLVGAGALLAVALVAVIFVRLNPRSSVSPDRIASLFVIPEAHAGDAFALVAEKQDRAGASVDTTFKVTSRVDVSAETLKQHLRILPAVSVDIQPIGDHEFRLTPTQALAAGEVYHLAVATAVQKTDGSIQKREFSWAIQTKDVFRVLSSVPGDKTSSVPLNSAIEVTMSQTGWEDPKSFFSITPHVDGRFEVHGRSLAFLPTKPLEPTRMYTATYKKGWKIAGSDVALAEDYVIRFETSEQSSPSEESRLYWDLASRYFEAVPQKDIFIGAHAYSQSNQSNLLFQVTGYRLTKDETKEAIKKFEAVPRWADWARSRAEDLSAYAKQQVFDVRLALEGKENTTYLHLPPQSSGYYAVHISPESVLPTSRKDEWIILQVTPVATYTIADKDMTYLWVMNMETQRPLVDVPVALDGKTQKTDDQGIARLVTPALLTSSSTDTGVAIADVGSAGNEVLIILTKAGLHWKESYSPFGSVTGFEKTWAYLFIDRPLYRLQDQLSFFGLAQDRDTRKPGEEIKVQLVRGGMFDLGTQQEKVYAETVLTPDASGFVKGSLSWERLAPGYYQAVLLRNGERVVSRPLEIRDVVKPAYVIDVLPNKQAVYVSEALDGKVKVTLFDGTPLAGHKIRVNDSLEVTTDENGFASYHLPLTPQTCDVQSAYGSCSRNWSESIFAAPVEAEEADIRDSKYVMVWRAKVATEVETSLKGQEATLSFLTRRVDTSKVQEKDILADPLANKKIEGRILERQWVKAQSGTRYDYLEKKNVPLYYYTLQETEVGQIHLATGADGKATMTLPLKADTAYRIVAMTDDGEGGQDVLVHFFSTGWYDQGTGHEDTAGISFESTNRQTSSYKVDEAVSLAFFKEKVVMPDQAAPTYLFIEAMRGIKKITASKQARYEFRYREELVPNMTVHGVVFGPFGFIDLAYYASFDSEQRELKMTLTPEQTSYAPGSQVKATVEVRNPDGSLVSDARVAVAAVDEALLAAAGGSVEEQPVYQLYGYVDDGVILTGSSHATTGYFSNFLADGRGGGGGGESIRRNFKDTAVFQVVSTDANGRASIQFQAPDNMTSWQVTAVGMTPDLRAGATQAKIVVTKPVFVDAVIPQSLLVSDKPVLKIQIFGAAAPSGEAVDVQVDAPSLGLTGEHVTGTIGLPLYVGIPSLVRGEHAIVFRIRTSQGNDAIERKIHVLDSRVSHDELATIELAPGVAFPDVGLNAETTVSFLPLGRARYLAQVQGLAYPWSARLESKVAAVMARGLLAGALGQKEIEPLDESLAVYQGAGGGLKSLPYASEDVELSSKIAALHEDMFDKTQLANYFWSVTDNQKTSREESLRALAGLAALGEPVLNRLHAASQLADLSWHEQLSIARGLEAAGDREAAGAMLENLLKMSEERDGLVALRVSEDPRWIMEATSEAAALAQSLSHPKAKGLEAFVEKNWREDAMTDLDRMTYLAHVIPTLPEGDVTLTYAIGNTPHGVKLQEGRSEHVTLTADEMKQFHLISVDGPAAAVFTRRVEGLPRTVPEVRLARSYAVLDVSATSSHPATLDALTEGTTLQISLTAHWDKNAEDGCYIVRDRLPSGLAPLQSISYSSYSDAISEGNYPVSVMDNEVSFVTCKRPDGKDDMIMYRARVVSRGTYLAEPASLQSMDAPSVTALSESKTIFVK